MDIEDLVLDARMGDKDALQEIIERFTPFVVKNARSIFIYGMDMEDLIEEGYKSVIKAVKSYDPNKNSSFTPYVMHAVKYNYYYGIRKCARHNSDISMQTPIGEGIELGEIFEDDTDIEEDYIHAEDLLNLKNVLDKLSPEERADILQYFNTDGVTLKQIAHDKGVKYTTLVKRKNALVLKLRRLMLEFTKNKNKY